MGVYVSVPFCRAKCSFCNFASGVGSGAALERYVDLLVAEIRSAREGMERIGAVLPERVDTLYFGGGTPSLLAPEQIQRIVAALRGVFSIDAESEITLEAAPGQIAGEVLEAALRQGVNRISLGVQSFVDQECTAVGRLHTGAECLEEIARLKRDGMANIGIDLIAGLPYQTHASWEETLNAATGAGVAHASVYLFEIDEDSRLGAEVLRGGPRFHAPAVGDEELAAELYERACVVLPQAGLVQYEISNFAQNGRESAHNRRYWTRAPYIGFGLDAHSMLRAASGGDVRFANTDELASYGMSARTLPDRIGEEAALEETLFLGLRMLAGVDASALQERFGREAVAAVAETVRVLARDGLMRIVEDRWMLTARGRLVSNEVFAEMLVKAAA